MPSKIDNGFESMINKASFAMTRIGFLHIWLFLFVTIPVAAGCASHAKDAKGISRVGYSIQVGAFENVKNAERLTSKLQGKGIDAFYFRKDNGYFAVRFGDYPSRESARTVARRLAAENIIGPYFIAPPRNILLSDRKGSAMGGKASSSGRKTGRDMGTIAARTAERFVGIPYQWGGDNVVEGMDCSGFVRAVYNLCGVNIPRTSREQYRTGDSVGRDSLRDGDLVFFGASENAINHVGIYVGRNRFVHAPRRGDDIKISSLYDRYFDRNFVGARRYF
jgi:cell wall-associated NlpC family hydrolase